jgi:hypothetical protein
MKYHLAQLNIARFKLPKEDPANAEFIENLDRVNAEAERQPGFVWRFTGEGNDTMDVVAFDDPLIASNMSVWETVESLAGFVYHNASHRDIMRRRREWFDKIEFYMVLWWIPAGELPTLEQAQARLELLKEKGPTEMAFTFRQPFPSPGGGPVQAIMDS